MAFRMVNSGDDSTTQSSAGCLAFDSGHAISVLEQQQDNEWCDVQLFGSDSTSSHGIKAHKMILSSASLHLREAFQSDGFVDSGGHEYRFSQVEHATLQIIVDFIYTGKLRVFGKNVGNRLQSVYVAADYLLMPKLTKLCGAVLGKPAYLHFKTAIAVWLFARKYRCKDLEDASINIIGLNVKSIAGRDEYLGLQKSNIIALLPPLIRYVNADPYMHHNKDFYWKWNQISTKSLDYICDAAIAWLRFKKGERKADGDEIMRLLPFYSLSVEALHRIGAAKYMSEHVKSAAARVLKVRTGVEKQETWR